MNPRITCPVCNTIHKKPYVFCPECGYNLKEVDAVTISINPTNSSESLTSSIKSRVQEIGIKAQRGLSDVSSVISEKAGDVSLKASSEVVEEKVMDSMRNLVNLMINVSKGLITQIPAETINAIDLEAEINFIAFTIGVSIDLKELKMIGST